MGPTCRHMNFVDGFKMFMRCNPQKGMKQSAFSWWFHCSWQVHNEEYEVRLMIAGCFTELCGMADASLLTCKVISSGHAFSGFAGIWKHAISISYIMNDLCRTKVNDVYVICTRLHDLCCTPRGELT